jgi:short-subunit dehydrogenase
MALRLARDGVSMILVDRDGAAAAATAADCQAAGAAARAEEADVTDRQALAACASTVPRVGLLACMAGVIHTGTLLASSYDDIDRVIAVNVTGTINTVKAFLPAMIGSGGGQLILCSSGFGLVAAPRYDAYVASKFGVRGLADALRADMAAAGHPVTVTCAFPGITSTGIMRRGTYADGEDREAVAARFDGAARTTPEAAAGAILRAARQGRHQAITGADARAAALAARVLGTGYQRLLPLAARARRLRTPPPA